MQTPCSQLGEAPVHHDAPTAVAKALGVIFRHIREEIKSIKDRYPDKSHDSAKIDAFKRLGFDRQADFFEKFVRELIYQMTHESSSDWFEECSKQVPQQDKKYCAFCVSVGVDWLDAKTLAESRLATMACISMFNDPASSSGAEFTIEPRKLSCTAATKYHKEMLGRGIQIIVIESEEDLEAWLFSGIGGIGLVAESLIKSQHKLARWLVQID